MGTKVTFLRVFMPIDVSIIGPNMMSKWVAKEPYVHIFYLKNVKLASAKFANFSKSSPRLKWTPFLVFSINCVEFEVQHCQERKSHTSSCLHPSAWQLWTILCFQYIKILFDPFKFDAISCMKSHNVGCPPNMLDLWDAKTSF